MPVKIKTEHIFGNYYKTGIEGGMDMEVFEALFRPGKINGLELKNRIVMPAIGSKLADDDGYATDRAIDYYVERARGGVGLVIVKLTSVMANAIGNGISGVMSGFMGGFMGLLMYFRASK